MNREDQREIEVLDHRVSLPPATGSMSGPEIRARLHKLMTGIPDRRQAGNVDGRRSLRRPLLIAFILFAAFVFGLWLNAAGKVG